MADLWDLCQNFLYTDDLHLGIADFLSKQGARKILDCACGTGNPSIELKKLGFDVVCSDGSEKMIAKFQENCEKENIFIPFNKINWVDLSGVFLEKFDCVLCRGNSLIYVNSWDTNKLDFSSAKNLIRSSLKAMFDVLKVGGFLYVDIYGRDEKEGFVDLGFKEINNINIGLLWHVFYNKESNIRCVRSWRTIVSENKSKQVFSHTYSSYLLSHAELVATLKDIGFSKVDCYVKIPGERHYSVFIAWK